MDVNKVIDTIVDIIKRISELFKKFTNEIFNYLKEFVIKANANRKVFYLVKNSKKYRIRKKNIHRLMRC